MSVRGNIHPRFIVAWIQGKRIALTYDELDQLSAHEQKAWRLEQDRIAYQNQHLYESLKGDSRNFHDQLEEWQRIERELPNDIEEM